MSDSSKFRSACFILAVGSGMAALFPEIALLPIQDAVSNMRAPETAASIARSLFAAGAAAFGIVFVAWRAIHATEAATIARIIDLRTRTFWILVFALAFFARLLIAAAVSYEPTSDALWYHQAATALAAGHGLAVDGELTAFRAPGYSFLLAVTYRLFGADFHLAWFWGALATVTTVLAVHFIASRLYGAGVARLATLSAAIYPALVLMTGQALSDLLFLAGFLVLIAFVLVSTPYRLIDSVVIGAAIGILTLIRGVAIGLVVVVPLMWVIQRREAKAFVISLIVIVSVFGTCVTPWALRNYAVFGSLTLGTNLGMNAYVGNHPGAPGGSFPSIAPTVPERARTNEVATDRDLLRQAIDFVISNPGEAVSIVPRKLMNLYLLETEAVTSLFQGESPSPAWIKYTLDGISQLVYVFFLIAFCVRAFDLLTPGRRPRGAQWTGWLMTGYFTVICLVLHGEDRYRLPILPWILIEGSVVLARIAAETRERRGA